MNRFAILLLTCFLTGCAGEPRVYAVIQDRAYSPSEFRVASQHKAFPTIISGNPFPLPDQQVQADILAAMQPANWWFSTAFTPDPAAYCIPTSDAATKTAMGGSVTARMAFCRDKMLLSTSHGAVDDIDSSTHPRFQEMITRMTMALFPQRRDDGDCGPLNNRRRC